MILAGIDIGAATAKAVILSNKKMLSFSIMPTGSNVTRIAEVVIQSALAKAALSMGNVNYVISTGYGRRSVPFAHKALTEIICHAAGVGSLMPGARTVIDIGGQDSKVIGLDDNGNITNFVMNDKCAAGTGRFLEVMARVLEVDIDEMGPISLRSKSPCQISSTCTVFAESEMVSLRAEGKGQEDLLAGIHKAIAHRIAIMGKPIGFKKDVVFTGGVAKNVGMKKAIEDQIGMEILTSEEPQIMGALGAAILAGTELMGRAKTGLDIP